MTRHDSMIAAAVVLAGDGFARIGWAPQGDGKAPVRKWKSDATDDPALVPKLLHGSRNALVIPKGRAIIIDVDQAEAWSELEAAGLPPTLTIDSPTPDHGHIYGWVPSGADMATIPGTFSGGEIRRHSPTTDTASMVLGPWALRSDGVYTPRGTVRTIAELPASVIEYLVTSAHKQDGQRSAARGPSDAGWKIANGRHDYLVGQARKLRGYSLSGDRLVDELLRLDRDRCDPPLADVPDRGEAEIRRIAEWTDQRIADDPPGVTITLSPERPEGSGRNLSERFTSPAELLARLPETPESSWHRYFYRGAIAELIGGAKVAGKTTFLGHLMAAVLDGRTYLGEPTTYSPIVFLTEQPSASLRAVLERSGLASRADLRILLWRDAHDVTWPEIVVMAVAECERVGARLLIVDTLPAFAGIRGDAENDAGAALAAIEPLQVAAADGLAVVVVRHARKAGGEVGESGRGSSAFTGAVDVVLQLARQATAARPTIRVLTALSRFDETPPEAVIELTDAGYVLLGDVAAVAFDEARRGILDVVPELPGGLTEAEIIEQVGGRKSSTGEALRSLVATGRVERSGSGRRGSPYTYAMTPADSGFVSPALRGRAVGESNSSAAHTDHSDPPINLFAIARQIYGEDLAEPEEVDAMIAAAFPSQGTAAR